MRFHVIDVICPFKIKDCNMSIKDNVNLRFHVIDVICPFRLMFDDDEKNMRFHVINVICPFWISRTTW